MFFGQTKPDGKAIVYTVKPRTVDAAWSINTIIHVASVADDDGDRLQFEDMLVVNYTTESGAMDTTPCFSPSGKRLAWLGSKRPGCEHDKLELIVHEVGSDKQPSTVQLAIDVSINEFVWADDDNVLFTAQVKKKKTIGYVC